MTNLLSEGQYESDIKSGSHGENFQYEFALTLFLRMRKTGSSRYRLAYEVKKADKFEDVVLIDDKQREVHFFQVKHADSEGDEVKFIDVGALFPIAPNRKGNGDFDLCKYISSFLVVNRSFEEEEFHGKFRKKYYVLTNKDLNDRELKGWAEIREEREVNEILQFSKSRTRQLKLIPTENAVKELREQINKEFLEVEEALVEIFTSGKVETVLKKYSTPLKNVLKIDKYKNCRFHENFGSKSKQFSVANLYNKLKDRLDMQKQVIIKENFLQNKSRSKRLPPYVSDDEIGDFFRNYFTLLVGLPNDLSSTIHEEALMWMKGCIRPDIIGQLNKKDMAQVVADLKMKFDKLNVPLENKIKGVLKQGDVNDCLLKIRENNKIFENEVLDELQGFYINRNIVCAANEDPNCRTTEDTDERISFSSGGTIDRVISDLEFVEELHGTFKDQQHIVLVAEPGMGKTSLLQFVAFALQKQMAVDVFLVYLSILVRKLDKVECVADVSDALNVLSAVLSEENCENIRTTLEKRDTEGYSIVMFFDGFDEIHSKYTDRVIQMMKLLASRKTIQIIISTRTHVKQLLESTFKLKSMILQPFSEEDQIRYLRTMWNVVDQANPNFLNYSKQLLDKFHSSIPSKLNEVSGLPLMMRMLAEIHSEQFELYLKATKTNFEQQVDFSKQSFNIAHLYEQFVRKCFHVKLKQKFQYRGELLDEELDSVIEGFILEHQLLAMKLLDAELLTNTSKNPHFQKKYDQFVSRCERKSEKSLLVKVVNGTVQFIHLSYAEYFVAKYLCDHIFTIDPERVIGIWFKNKAVRILSMIMLNDNEAFYGFVNTLYEKSRKIALWACQGGCFTMVSYLVRNLEFLPPYCLNMMLQISAEIGHVEMCEYLIQSNADPNAVDKDGWLALHVSAQNGHTAVVELLLKNKAKVDVRSPDGWTSVQMAAQNGHASVVELLLKNQAKVDAQTKQKWTALHLATSRGHASIVDILLQNGANVDAQTQQGWTALHDAAQKGYALVVDLLLRSHAKVDIQTEERATALHFATRGGHVNIVNMLLQNGANVEVQYQNEYTALHLATGCGHDAIVYVLLKNNAKLDAQSKTKQTPLHFAASEGHDTVVDILLKNGANVEALEQYGWTALHCAAQKGHGSVVDLLLKNRAEVDARTEDKWTALHYAASEGHVTIVDMLLQNGANVEALEQRGWTALHCAAQKGHASVVDLLLKNRAEVDARAEDKWTSLHFAASRGHDTIADMLLQNGANVDALEQRGWTAVHWAAKRGHALVLDLLLRNQAKVDVQADKKYTALHFAAHQGHANIVNMLLQNGANVDAQDENEWTALHVAVRKGHTSVVAALLKNQAKVGAQTDSQLTALHLAASRGHVTVVDMLLQNGANVDALNHGGCTALQLASTYGHALVEDLLLRHQDKVHVRTEKRNTAMIPQLTVMSPFTRVG